MPTVTVSTPIPAGVSEDKVIAVLHNHDAIIKAICPQLISYQLESGDPHGTAVYQVTDKKPIGQTTWKLTITNHSDGVDTLVNAKPPVGTLVISCKWRVANGQLKEDADIDANMLLKKMVRGSFEKDRPGQHSKLLAQA